MLDYISDRFYDTKDSFIAKSPCHNAMSMRLSKPLISGEKGEINLREKICQNKQKKK